MIGWGTVVGHALWIAGLSILLGAFSYHDWQARRTARSRRDLFAQASWRVPCAAGSFLVCSGALIALAAGWWDRALWAVLAIWFGRGVVKGVRGS